MSTVPDSHAPSLDPRAGHALLDDPIVAGLARSSWIKIGIVALLFAGVFWPNLRRIFAKVNFYDGDPNWQHGLFVPLVGLYFLYVNRDELLKAPVRPSWAGLGVLIVGLFVSMYSIWPLQNDFVWDFGMVIALFGLVLLLCGWGVMRTAWFPIVFLVCAIPWPGLFYGQVAGPLQELAAKVAVKTLQVTGVDAYRAGTKILYQMKTGEWRALDVAIACAGLKALMTFISLAAAIAFLTARPLWQRALIVASAIPIAILCNVMRVAGQGLIDYYWSPEFSRGFAHGLTGLVMQIPAFFLLLLVVWLLDKIFLDEADEQERAALAGAARAKLIVAARRPGSGAIGSSAEKATVKTEVAPSATVAATAAALPTTAPAAKADPVLKLVRPPESVPVPKAPPAPRPATSPGVAKAVPPNVKTVEAPTKSVSAPARPAAAPSRGVGGAAASPANAKPPAAQKPVAPGRGMPVTPPPAAGVAGGARAPIPKGAASVTSAPAASGAAGTDGAPGRPASQQPAVRRAPGAPPSGVADVQASTQKPEGAA